MSRLSALLGAVAVAIAALAAGCHTCEDHDGSTRSIELAKFNYENGKYDQARVLYQRAVDLCPSNVEGWLGLANACRETGNNEFKSAADMAAQGKIQESKRIFKSGAEHHALSYEILQRRIKEDAQDMSPHYGLGLLYYQRATSVLPFPFPVDDTVNRPKERDLAIS